MRSNRSKRTKRSTRRPPKNKTGIALVFAFIAGAISLFVQNPKALEDPKQLFQQLLSQLIERANLGSLGNSHAPIPSPSQPLPPSSANAPRTFVEAKRLAWGLYANESKDYYCGCRYQGNEVDWASCGYQPRRQPERAARIEWEHIVPAWQLGHNRQCWKDGGRKNCATVDSTFARAEGDLHNLIPVVGEVNGDRSNFPFGEVRQKPNQYGACQFVVDFDKKVAMPPEHLRGLIARTYLYMQQRYQVPLPRQEQALYERWNRDYPVSALERQRHQKVACAQGANNPFVDAQFDLSRCPAPSKRR